MQNIKIKNVNRKTSDICPLQVNTQLYSAREKEDLAELIRVMIAYNMTYNQEKTPEGQYAYVLDPYVYLWRLTRQLLTSSYEDNIDFNLY